MLVKEKTHNYKFIGKIKHFKSNTRTHTVNLKNSIFYYIIKMFYLLQVSERNFVLMYAL